MGCAIDREQGYAGSLHPGSQGFESPWLQGLPWPLRLRPAYHEEVSSQDGGGRRPDYPPWSGEPAEGPDILEQGSDRPPVGWRPSVRSRQPLTAAIILGVTGLLVGLAAGYAAGTLHAEKAAAPSAQARPTASPTTISPAFIEGTPSQFQLWCSATGTLRQPDMPVTNVTAPTVHGTVIMISPSTGPKLTCRR
jgi:F0F1-type ATP synthase membrane subunit c/vacuolar-type H+-ATPase subunit K